MDDDATPGLDAELRPAPNWRGHGVLLLIAAAVFACLVAQQKLSAGGWIRLDFTGVILAVGAGYAVSSTGLVAWRRVSTWPGLLMAHAASAFAMLAALVVWVMTEG